MNETKMYDHVVDEFNFQKDILERQIESIELRQQEIQVHISSIEAANNHLDILIQQEKDNRKKSSYYGAKIRNIELLSKLYDTYNNFESVKFRYHNNISDLIYKNHRLIEVEIRKIDEKLDKISNNELVEVFKQLSNLFSQNCSQLPPEIEKEIVINEGEFKL